MTLDASKSSIVDMCNLDKIGNPRFNNSHLKVNGIWIPGGKTLGGSWEAIIDQITEMNNPELYEAIIKNAEGY